MTDMLKVYQNRYDSPKLGIFNKELKVWKLEDSSPCPQKPTAV
jgi:hypothetical protein